MLEVDLVAEQGVALGGGAQRVERRRDDGRRRLLVVEDCDGADGHEDDEDGKGAAPAVGDFADIWFLFAIALVQLCQYYYFPLILLSFNFGV